MKLHRIGILGLLVIGATIVILIGCSVEEAQPTPTKTPPFVPTSTATPYPIRTLTALQQEAIDYAAGRKSVATSIPNLAATPIPTPTPTRVPIPTSTPAPPAVRTPTPTPIPCASGYCGLGYHQTGGTNATTAAAKDLWPNITVGERQLAGFMADCKLTGVGTLQYTQDGDHSKYSSAKKLYLPNRPLGDIIEKGLNPWGPVWQDRDWWWEEERISIDGSGAYREGGSCLLVSGPDWPWFDGITGKVRVRLVPRGDTSLSPEQLEFGEGYHYISNETGYDGIYDIEMWWIDPDVLQEDRRGEVILFHFLSYGPGRREVNNPPLDHVEVARSAWDWCCSEEAKKTRERLRSQ